MILRIHVLYIINAWIRIVQNFVDRPSASTSSASSWGVSVLLYKAVIRTKFYGKQGNPVIRFYKQRYTERYFILRFNVRNIFQRNSPAIGSFLWVVMLIMIMKPHLRSIWEENIEDLVRGKFPNSMVLMNQIFLLPSLPTNVIL